jgi:glycosyltransferase 2 family protein
MYKHYTKIIVLSLALSVAFYIVNIFSMYFFALTASVEINLMYLAFIVPAVFLVVMIPISINGIGLQEGTFFFYLSLLGIDSSSALIVALLPRIGMLIFSLIGGLLYMMESIRKGPITEH